ncbi:hypothetical protein C8R46DRAFT_910619 [Mycena filopes]|nr:hypothetical protein C8R46DRAFT_910619 [Mycena filopes]
MGPRVPEPVIYSEWRSSVVGSNKRKNAVVDVPAQEQTETDDRGPKRLKVIHGGQVAQDSRSQPNRDPTGLIWDSQNYSCAYDATFTILANVWVGSAATWTARFLQMSQILGDLGAGLHSMTDDRTSLEQVRNTVRRKMNAAKPNDFPYGPNSTSIDRVALSIFPTKYYGVGRQSCARCGHGDPRSYGMLESCLSAGLSDRQEYPEGVELQQWLSEYLAKGKQPCPTCRANGVRQRLKMLTILRDVPPIIIFDITHEKLIFSEKLTLLRAESLVTLRLRGIIYGGQGHFTCRYIGRNGEIWFHDGITTGRTCLRERNLRDLEDKLVLHRCGEKTAVTVIYARDDL